MARGRSQPHARTRPGLRERRKLRTEQDLLRCGFDLFLARGYDRTTVGDIAHLAEVSERTFFRYFASKEELVLRPLREAHERYLAEVARRPAWEEPLCALREAGRNLLRSMDCRGTLERYLAALRVMCVEPAVLAAALRLGTQQQRDLAEVLRARERTEAGDPRPSLLAGACHAAWLVATLAWQERCDGSPQALQTTADRHLGLMPSAVQGRWH